jgi:hypothetical protein
MPPINCTNWRNIVDVHGARIFMLGDRGFHVPRTVSEMETVTCPRLIEAGDKIKGVLKSCLKPFPKTVAGMILRGTRKVTRENCSNATVKAEIVRHLRCVRDDNRIDQFHDVMDKMAKQLYMIKTKVPVEKMIDVSCCAYIARKADLEANLKKFCPPASTTYALDMVDRMMREAMDFVCGQYQQDAGKCAIIEKKYPFNEKENRKDTLSVLIPMLDVMTEIGTQPDE